MSATGTSTASRTVTQAVTDTQGTDSAPARPPVGESRGNGRFLFVPAVKTGSKIRLALFGPPGSGKTFTALVLATALGSNPGMIDTERQRGRKYADMFGFRYLPMDTFNPDDLTRATIEAAEQGIDPLILDTWSPFWSGPQGMLEQVDQEARSFDGWKKMRPVERRMTDALLSYPGHVIVNLRVKLKYVVEQVERDNRTKTEARRVGLMPEQREGIEYDFDIVADMDEASLRITKSMCLDLPSGKVIDKPKPELAYTIQSWLDRAAVGEPMNPVTIAHWALADSRAVDELRVRFEQLEAANQEKAAVYDRSGNITNIGDLLRSRAAEIRREQQRAVRAVEPAQDGVPA